MGNYIAKTCWWIMRKPYEIGLFLVVNRQCLTTKRKIRTECRNPAWGFVKQRIINNCLRNCPPRVTPLQLGVSYVICHENGQPRRLYMSNDEIMLLE
jgi:hypothetical protein